MPNSPRPTAAGPSGGDDGTFRWSLVPAADRDWLRARTEDVVTYAYRGACDAVRIGTILNEAKSRLGRGEYEGWVRSELPFSLSAAKRYRQVADAFGAFASAQFELFDPSALYVLAQLGAPAAARELAVQTAGAGQRVTHARALEMVAAARPEPEPTGREVSDYEARMKQLDRRTVLDERGREKLIDQERRTATLEANDLKRWAELGRSTAQLADVMTVIRIEKIDDPEDVVLYSVTCHREDDTPRVAVRRSLEDAIAAAAGREPKKRCPGCETEKAVGEFGFDATNGDGRNRYCKRCERTRRSEGRKRKKKRRGAGPAS